jgi:hypothetical protein
LLTDIVLISENPTMDSTVMRVPRMMGLPIDDVGVEGNVVLIVHGESLLGE